MKTSAASRTDKLTRWMWMIVIGAAFFYWAFAFFFWHIVDWLTPLIAPSLWLPVCGVTVVALIFAVVLPFRRWRSRRIASLLPLAFFILCFVATGFVDFTRLWLRANFRLARTNREQVVRRIALGEFHPNVSYNSALINLPAAFKHLSLGGGDVVIQRRGAQTKVLFFTFRGILDNFAGFVYASDGSPPQNGDFLGDFFIIEKLDDKWYYVSAR